MVLRKHPPPSLDYLAKGNGLPEIRPPTSQPAQSSQSANSASPTSPKRLTRRRAQSSPHPRQIPSLESVYSPDLNTSPAFDLMPIEQAQRSPPGTASSDPPNPWADDWVDIPAAPTSAPLHQTPDTLLDENTGSRVPPIVVAGTQRRLAENEWQPTPGSSDASEWEQSNQQQIQLQSNNPFLRVSQSDRNPWENNQEGAGGSEVHNSRAASFPHSDGSDRLSQTEGFIPMAARLSLLDQQGSESPWTEERSTASVQPTDMREDQQFDRDRVLQLPQNSASAQVPMGMHSADGQIYNPQGDQPNNQRLPALVFDPSQPASNDKYNDPPQYSQHHIDPGKLGSDTGFNTPSLSISNATTDSSHELIDLDAPNEGDSKGTNEDLDPLQSISNDGPTLAPKSSTDTSLEDRTSKPIPRPSLSEADIKRQKEQRSETYSIRHVNWTDVTGNLRNSPVLVQNENGPCPLLALVNALVLRAGQGAQPPIVKALQTREQISLGLLIEALFDELTTCLGPTEELPDIEALSQFLTMLHTGMNVNPRLTLESECAVGSFLQTSDIRLYGTFGVPLIHGWVAAPSSETHESMKRVAQYHEDIQLLRFHKEELEDRVFRGGVLNSEEEQVTKDIQNIQQFVDVDNATQLSAFGLDRLAQELAPGSVSILFRNDHFSTLYKHPQLHQLYTMVTDAGYSSHAEVVWECLADVNGSLAEFFSGDFRPVGHTPAGSGPAGPRTSSNGATLTVPGESVKNGLSPQEQSDADYAYALQLQFEEEQRNNRARDRRASAPQSPRERSGPNVSHSRSTSAVNSTSNRGRGSGLRQSYLGRPARGNDNPEDGPPPPYSQAADSPAYSIRESRSQFTDFSQEDRYVRPPYNRRGAPVSTLPDRPKDRSSRDCVVM